MNTATETITRTPAEQALEAAHAIRGVEAVESARIAAEAASARVEGFRGPVDSGWPARLKAALVVRDQAEARHHFLAGLEGDGDPDPLVTDPDVYPEFVSRYVVASGPHEFARLVRQLEADADRADGQIGAINARLEVWRTSYRTGQHGATFEKFTELVAGAIEERGKLEAKARRRREAAQQAREGLRRLAPEAIGNPDALRAGLRESLALARRGDPILDGLVSRLESVEADLVRLGLGGDVPKAESGRIGDELQAMKTDLTRQIKARKRETYSSTVATAADLAERAAAGDPDALTEVVGLIRQQPLAFPPKLAETITQAVADALATVADVVAPVLLQS